jgi:transcriptional regulator of arginine metabolism
MAGRVMAPGSAGGPDPVPARTGASPLTKAARHAQIAAILARAAAPVRSQDDLAERLARRGVRVTQATLSRDLEEIGAVRLRGADGALVYALPAPPGGPEGAASDWAASDWAANDSAANDSAAADDSATNDGAADDSAADDRAANHGAANHGAANHGAAPGAGLMPGQSGLRRVAADLLLAAEASANLVVLRTPAGAAQFLASVIDHAGWPSVLGTVAGDDTVLVIARDPAGGNDLAGALLDLAERRGRRSAGPARTLDRESGLTARRKS